jgi:hypothetical protein
LHWGRFSSSISIPLPILISPTTIHSSSSIIRGWYNKPDNGQRSKWTLTPPQEKTQWPESSSELYRSSDRRLSAKLVPTFTDTGCHVISVTDLLRQYSWFSKPEPLLFLPSSSSVVLTRPSGPHFRPTTSQKIW